MSRSSARAWAMVGHVLVQKQLPSTSWTLHQGHRNMKVWGGEGECRRKHALPAGKARPPPTHHPVNGGMNCMRLLTLSNWYMGRLVDGTESKTSSAIAFPRQKSVRCELGREGEGRSLAAGSYRAPG